MTKSFHCAFKFAGIVSEINRQYLVVKSTLVKKLTTSPNEATLFTLKKKFKDAGCECSLTADEHNTTLYISYANIYSIVAIQTFSKVISILSLRYYGAKKV